MAKNKPSQPAKPVQPAQPAPQKKSTALLPMIVVLLVAVVLIVFLFVRSNNLNSQLDSLSTDLADTQALLQQTITEKEELEEQLTIAQDDLREAQLTLEESTGKIAELEGQVATLTEQNNSYRSQIATLTADLETAHANMGAAEVYLLSVEQSIQLALDALHGNAPAPTAAPAPEVTAEPAPTEEAPAEEPAPEVTEEPAPVVEAPAEESAPEVTEEPAPAEEAPAEEPAPEVTEEPAPAEEPAGEPVVLPEVQYPIVNVTEEGSVIETETAVVTLRLDENNAIATLSATVNGEAVAEDVIALFIGKTLPLNAEEFTLDEAGVVQAIIDALNVLAEPQYVNG